VDWFSSPTLVPVAQSLRRRPTGGIGNSGAKTEAAARTILAGTAPYIADVADTCSPVRDLHRQFDQALSATKLPERPDYERANEFLVNARRRALAEELP